jgi:hypothetical protein
MASEQPWHIWRLTFLLHGCFSLSWIFLLCFFPLIFSTLFFFFHSSIYVLFLFRLIIYVDYGVKEGKGQQSLVVFEWNQEGNKTKVFMYNFIFFGFILSFKFYYFGRMIGGLGKWKDIKAKGRHYWDKFIYCLNMYFHQKIPFLSDYKCCCPMVTIMLQAQIIIPLFTNEVMVIFVYATNLLSH